MTGIEYQQLAMRTMNPEMDSTAKLSDAALGLCGESGEIADILKKYLYQGHGLDPTHIAKELGDVLWYVALACTALGMTMDKVMQMNIDKLKARYPEGFDADRSVNRVKGDI